MHIIDLSTTIAPSRPDALPFERIEINYLSHDKGASQIETMFKVPPDLLRNDEGWAVEEFTKLATHSVTHVDAPWHYNSVIRGQTAATIDELPLEWFFSDGVVIDMTGRADGTKIEVTDLETAFADIGYNLKPLDIVLIRTGRDEFYGQPDYVWRGCAVTAEATCWLYDGGVRVMGIDAWAHSTGRRRRLWLAGRRECSGPPTSATCRIRRSSAWSTSAPCRHRGSRWPASH
jgi:kynurenine formamidase